MVEDTDMTTEHDAMLNYLCPGLDESAVQEADNSLAVMMTLGSDPSVAKRKVAELFSSPRVTTEIGKLPCVQLKPAATFDLQEGADGSKWNFLDANVRSEARR
jgi:hypothetical protein